VSGRQHAIRIGLVRGWTEFILSLKSPQDQGFYLFNAVAVVGYLYFSRNREIEGTTLAFPTLALPGIMAALIVFSLVAGPAYALAMEREDGTLLRAKCAPHGITGYVAGQIVLHTLSLIPMLLVIMIPSAVLLDVFSGADLHGWFTFTWVVALGLLATLPLGLIIGSVVPNAQKAGTWGFLPVISMAMISGIFTPMSSLWGWVQGLAQMLPLYWIGIGLRSAFLPAEAALGEIGGTWRTLETVGVLSVWAVAGLILSPVVLRRMARRQSGAAVAEARDQAAQWVR
jgi:ABC-2 type transport system permease protein